MHFEDEWDGLRLTSGLLSVLSFGEDGESSSASSSSSLSSSASVLSVTGGVGRVVSTLLDVRDRVFFQVFFFQIPTAFFACASCLVFFVAFRCAFLRSERRSTCFSRSCKQRYWERGLSWSWWWAGCRVLCVPPRSIIPGLLTIACAPW